MTTEEMIAVMQGYQDGKEIEYTRKRYASWTWKPIATPKWNWRECDYRIKPEPKYVPYDSVTEVDKDKWFKHKKSGILYRIDEVDLNDNTVYLAYGWVGLQALFEGYTYEDGTPCGKKVE